MTLSQVRPYFRASQPTPPPSVRPAMPVFDTTPAGTAKPMHVRLAIELAERSRPAGRGRAGPPAST